ncbi:MAG: hypothetical protein ACFFAE_14810 [Candidatus Hodarchaeota archaeon]
MLVLITVEAITVLLFYLIAALGIDWSWDVKKILEEYIRAYGYSGVCGLKFKEGIYFQREEVIKPAAEVGIARRETSNLHFRGRCFDIVTECLYENIRSNYFTHWNNKIICDFRVLPFKTDSLNSIFTCMLLILYRKNNYLMYLEKYPGCCDPGENLYSAGLEKHICASLTMQGL